MEGLQTFKDFYETIADDVRIGLTHVCLYMALLHEWNLSASKDGFPVNRHVLMRNARISRRTYNKCMNQLHQYGYIKYEPSLNPLIKSKVYLKRL